MRRMRDTGLVRFWAPWLLLAFVLAPGFSGCVTVPTQPKIAYPSPPPEPVTQTDYTRNFRKRLQAEALPKVEAAKPKPEEPVQDTVERLYP